MKVDLKLISAALNAVLERNNIAPQAAVPLRTLIYGASPIRPETLSRVLGLLPRVRMVNLFGQTEGSPITCLTPADHDLASSGRPELLQSVGRPVPGLDVPSLTSALERFVNTTEAWMKRLQEPESPAATPH